ncbi:hypothetical protein ACH5RR_009285 [Cinchona calisaya]|uniref:HAT C-terminal dimerisation domain-containing protein n=1 Tax=Cinchona calisaya TaxID=153742 RepID=A0ABD3AEI7_9GENT
MDSTSEQTEGKRKNGRNRMEFKKQQGESGRYPTLAHTARDILAVPVSTVASETAFSTDGRILDSFRTSLTPKIVEAIMCARDWLRSPDSPVAVKEDLHLLENIENGVQLCASGVGICKLQLGGC